MGSLTPKTRGGSSTKGKCNVYFAAHPQDFDIYFDVLSDEILNHSNCAIWYTDSEQGLNDEEHLFDLEQMQLFVFPITARFLTNSSTALDVYNYAAIGGRQRSLVRWPAVAVRSGGRP